MGNIAFPSGFAEDTSPTKDTYVLGSGGKLKLSTLIGGGAGTNPTAYTANGVFDVDSSFWFVDNTVTGMGMPTETVATQRLVYVRADGPYFGPVGYPTTGTISVGGTVGAAGASVAIARGVYIVTHDGADNWALTPTDANGAKVDFDGTHAPPFSADNASAGWTTSSMIYASNSKFYLCTYSDNSTATWIRPAHAGVIEDHIADTDNPHAVTAAQVGAVAVASHSAVSVVGRSANSTGDAADIAAASNDTFLQRVGNALTWAGLTIGMVADRLLTWAKMPAGSALSVVGRSANSSGDVADIAAGSDGDVLRRSGATLGFGTVATAGIADNAVTLAKLATQATRTILANITGSTAVPTAVALTSAHLHGLDGLTSKSASFTVGATEWAFNVDTSGGAVNVTFPDPALFTGRGVFLHKTTTDANAITPVSYASETFNGAAAAAFPGSTFASRLSWFVYSDGTNWHY